MQGSNGLPWRVAAACVILGATSAPASAQPTELAVKAAFLSKFAAYVNWPVRTRPGRNGALTLCVVGSDPFGQILDDAVQGQRVDDHPIAVKRLPSAAGAETCHLAFVQGRDRRSSGGLLAGMQGKPILTVTDAGAGSQRGIIHFVIVDGRVRFMIDQAAAQRDGLDLNARLLAIALEVKARR